MIELAAQADVDLTTCRVSSLLDKAEHDIENHPDRGQCYMPKSKLETDSIDR